MWDGVRILLSFLIAFSLAVPNPTHATTVTKPIETDVCAEGNVHNDPNDPTIKNKHCVAAEDDDDAIVANTVLASLWGIPLIICGIACFYKPLAGTCSDANLIGGIIDAGVTFATAEEMQAQAAAITGLGMDVALWAASNKEGGDGGKGGGDGPKGDGAKGDGAKGDGANGDGAGDGKGDGATDAGGDSEGGDAMSCVTAVMIAGKIAMKLATIAAASDSMMDNLKIAKKIHDPFNILPDPRALPSRGTGSAPRTGVTLTTPAEPEGEDDNDKNDCDRGVNGDPDSGLRCAAAKGTDFSGFLNTDAGDKFQEFSGLNLNDWLKINGDDRGASLSSNIAGAFGNAEAGAIFKGIIDDYTDRATAAGVREDSAATYRGGGGGRRSGGGGDENPFSEMGDFLKEIMGGNKKKKDKLFGAREIRFGKYKKALKGDATRNRDLSLFLRVSYRYWKNRRNLTFRPFGSKYNQAIEKQRRPARKIKRSRRPIKR